MAGTAEDIQAQMRQMRCELGEGMDDLVENARVMADWRYYVHRYPWACVGAAAVAGFLLVPTRTQVIRPDPAALAEELARRHLVMPADGEAPTAKHGVIAALAAMAGNALLQGGIALVRSRLTEYLNSQLMATDGEQVASNGGVPER
jgi:hypothetical protein